MVAAVESMAYIGEAPWHKLGVKIEEENITTKKMLKISGLDWEVEKQAIFTKSGKTINDKFALVRSSDDSVLSLVGSSYKPVQNATALEFFNEFVKNGAMKMETAGSLCGGQFVFALASIQHSFGLKAGRGREDEVKGYLLFSSPHLIGHSLNVMFTPIRVVCMNTLAAALRTESGGKFTLYHSQKFDPEIAKRALGLAKGQLDFFGEEAKFLSAKKYKDEDVENYFNQLWPLKGNNTEEKSNTAIAALQLLDQQPGADLFPGTWWNALNVVTFITDHLAARNDNNRMRRAWFGNGRLLKQQALKKAIDFARAA